MDTLNDLQPQTGTVDQWSEALQRLEDYLRAHQIPNRLHQSQLALTILKKAMLRHAQEPTKHPTTVALEEAHDEIEQWFRNIFSSQKIPVSRLAASGRVALFVCDGNDRWPSVFLSQQLPDDFRKAMEKGSVQTGPNLQISNMIPRKMDYGPLEDFAEGTWQKFRWGPTLRAFIFWMMIFVVVLMIHKWRQ